MFINKDSIKVKISSMQNYLSLGSYLVEAQYGYHKLWGSDSGRNLAGVQTGTLIGIFPKLTLHFRKLSKAELELITPILDEAVQSVQYYDPKKKATVTMDTYTGDYEIVNKRIVNATSKNEPFDCSFVSVRKRA